MECNKILIRNLLPNWQLHFLAGITTCPLRTK